MLSLAVSAGVAVCFAAVGFMRPVAMVIGAVAWLGAAMAVTAVAALRLPRIRDDIDQRIADLVRDGELPVSEEQTLAVRVALVGALAVLALVNVVVFALMRRLARRLALPSLAVAGRRVDAVWAGALLVAGVIQASALFSGAVRPRSEPLVWACILAVLLVAAWWAYRSRLGVRRTGRLMLVMVATGGVYLAI